MGRATNVNGVDQPMPMSRRLAGVYAVHDCDVDTHVEGNRINLVPDSKLAARFPHLVQTRPPT